MSDLSPQPNITITPRYRHPPWLLLLLLIPAIIFPHRLWLTLMVSLGLIYLIARRWAHTLGHNLHAQRHLHHDWLAVGDQLTEQFTLHNPTLFPALWLQINDHSNIPNYRLQVVHSLSPRGQYRWRQQAICQQRGHFHLGPWTLHTSDPFGLFHVAIHYPQQHDIIIHPPIHRALPLPLPAGQHQGRANRARPNWHANNQTSATRPYQPGDPRRWIHWPTSARHNSLHVRQFDANSDGDIWLLLDLDHNSHLNPGPDGTEEHMVILAAALTARALRQQRPIGLALYQDDAPSRLPPQLGQGQLWRALRALALLRANSPYPLDQTLTDFARYPQRGASILIITPNLTPAWLPALTELQRHGLPASLVLLDRYTFGDTTLPPHHAAQFQNQLHHLGLTTHLSAHGQTGVPPEQHQSANKKYRSTHHHTYQPQPTFS
ncbi:MAG TPA: DUF58 domain-containing protein [Anaerolineae bacterium]|nr:DUF58 domain-containing protein [Anaerolineae bacterium]